MENIGCNLSAHLKKALVDDEKAKFIYINNFEVEQYWKPPETVGIPSVSIGNARLMVNRLEEQGVLLASPTDIVILKRPVSTHFLQYLQSLLECPGIIYVENSNPNLNITKDILNCQKTIQHLKELKNTNNNIYFMPYGCSEYEEQLSELTGIPLAVPSSHVFSKVNTKVYSRVLNQKVNIRQIPGGECDSVDSLLETYQNLKHYLISGERLVLKESLGVSGKGLIIIDSEEKFNKAIKMIEKGLNKKNNGKVSFVLEKWIRKTADINYQILIERNGKVIYYGAKECIVEDGVHRGHLYPTYITRKLDEELRKAGEKIGRQLYQDGYYGIVGIDAIYDQEDMLWPNLEINARFNMASYQMRIQENFLQNQGHALAKYYELKLSRQISFNEIFTLLENFMITTNGQEGFLINNFATVNSGFSKEGKFFKGRLYGVLMASNMGSLFDLDRRIQIQLNKIQE
ncbi:ATP-grasp domain-containing protein [Viridibacillus sp. FSL R5-0477]|uniref:ATP-grasp domain-containing protein n=1 Tax=Viridibacillus arenosi FSL R5-213 TaxID=1227360 RepID=W4F4A8_9BACL|nr:MULTISPECIES: ATP-grasp domain-containing protein [Viridibacillus]ETT86896.1 hypothetical protein C176_09287 [Viridibacillus arenosi FSL R5-213]OMC83152.1 hypothetical protein BK128_18710 [Viridibacillus sp. FSL H7-0596]OMC83254.1 hypothetical protein BK130_06810 [Viridibacillus sp. FSL H8-0123]OMC88165.1 hypothetical protein BK137_19050 [Viridibacillus arenosi]